MDVDMSLEIWNALKSHLVGGDLMEAADDFVHVLIEHGYSAEHIAEYTVDPEIKAALRPYYESDEDDYDEDEEDDVDELRFD